MPITCSHCHKDDATIRIGELWYCDECARSLEAELHETIGYKKTKEIVTCQNNR